jgi:hypothetical protein
MSIHCKLHCHESYGSLYTGHLLEDAYRSNKLQRSAAAAAAVKLQAYQG